MKLSLFFLLVLLSIGGHTQNIALQKPVIASSEASGFPVSNLVDGKISRNSVWKAANGKAPHIIEIDFRKYYNITGIRVHSGIMDAEKKPDEMSQAAGFWSIKNFKLQYWDDANWSDLPQSEVHENRLTTAAFDYTSPINTFKIRLICDDGEPISIMEIEVFGKEAPNMPAPPALSTSVAAQQVSNTPKEAGIKVSNRMVGKTMKYVGYNQGYYMPNSNVSGWVEYSAVNAFRVWASLNSFVPQTAVQVDSSLSSVTEFDKRKQELRKNPEHNRYIDWSSLLPLYDRPDSSSTNAMVYNYALSELKRLGIDVILQISSTDFDDSWGNKWKQWQRYYALAYYSARKGDVTMFALMNEPNHRNAGPMKLDQWISAMQIVSDAIHCAVNDVNKKYGKKLAGKFVGPVTAGNNPEWWTAVAKNIRTDYHGKTLDHDLLQIFSTHSYNSPAVGYEGRIDNIRKLLVENHPAHRPIPIVYTEIGRWMNAYLIDKEETMDDPSLFTEWAGIYSNNMKNGGYGMFAFKFANTASGPYPRGIKSGHHFIWQGKRIVEDAYQNIALGAKVRTSNRIDTTTLLTDGIKTDQSTWVSDSTAGEKWIELDLGRTHEIGSAVVYTGDASGVYTSPERVRNFRLQYQSPSGWKDIPGTIEKDNKYAQAFQIFSEPVSASRVRMISADAGRLKVREIKLFEKGDGPSAEPSFDVSGIQRTGEVVRLFAKGFKNERMLLETRASVEDNGLDSYTSYDTVSGNYYMWLVQRGGFDYRLRLDLNDLKLPSGTVVSAETVSPVYYGEVTGLYPLQTDGSIRLTLSPQSVVLLTLPKLKSAKKILSASASTTVSKAASSKSSDLLNVELDAAKPENNKVAYLYFTLPADIKRAHRVLLKVNGYTNKSTAPFRFHVYGIPGSQWNTLDWNNAPLLDRNEALITEVGRKSFVAGELAFTTEAMDHYLDVTDLVKKHGAAGISFALVRETRQLGDDEDKGFRAYLQLRSGSVPPQLLYW